MVMGQPGSSDATDARRKGRQRRMTNGLVGISAAAIVTVYAAGYLNTRADDGVTVLPPTPTVMATVPTAAPTPPIPRAERRIPGQDQGGAAGGLRPGGSAPTAPQPAATAPAAPAAPKQSGAYRDGTYTGTGTSRHGSITATVVVQGGRIVSANISNCQTRYPCSKVASLVSETVARQSVPVDYVSGSTDSSRAYATAVANALAQAG